MSGKGLLALFCALSAGCVTTNEFVEQFRLPNPVGKIFREKQEVVDNIPVGTSVEKAQTVMRAHGFEQWSSEQHDHRRIVTFRVCRGHLRVPGGEDTWVILNFDHDSLAEIELHH
jgi:hypothetical protein